ncbi:RNA chaperone Hfq [Bacillus cereus VD196]|uniref:RNA chaperone Hfq n=1 Tax=Bacillus cereus VD196 TaxID=1053243 RepID=A0A9W5PYP6_BACCE|nr:RNA chaperone Hfq [Bacillus cereus]EJR91146.1 RNA chaperone Hfq [Bacillus cereus VD200]EOO62098.1 RNA chaperone Hfq [Bacillus cereus VD196]
MGAKSKAPQKKGISNIVSLQDQQLQEAVQGKKSITMILLNGFRIEGTIKGYDMYSILFEFEGKQQLIYKHVISTIRF